MPRPAAAARHPAQALSLHIGVNRVDPAHYAGWDGPLEACEFDAEDMAALARDQQMKPTLLLTKQATRARVLAAIRRAARALQAGDLLLLTYAGHGGQVRDVDGDEVDGQDETWCLFDGQLVDDELYYELSRFAAGTRIVVVSDSCHSGTVTRDVVPRPPPPGLRPRLMPPAVARRVYDRHQAFYDKVQQRVVEQANKARVDPDTALAQVGAAGHATQVVGRFQPAVLLIAGCQDNQTAMDGEQNGVFTGELLRIWNRGAFAGDYLRLHAQVRAALPPSQSPNLFTLGDARSLLVQRPFSI
ncbi:caspase family protein [Piscinibacter sakaiensis]|uniref:caspase family protein n=1 Tax=Piscinibacter sakaiensis TaxID=1547922 RepID=UPI003AABD516